MSKTANTNDSNLGSRAQISVNNGREHGHARAEEGTRDVAGNLLGKLESEAPGNADLGTEATSFGVIQAFHTVNAELLLAILAVDAQLGMFVTITVRVALGAATNAVTNLQLGILTGLNHSAHNLMAAAQREKGFKAERIPL